MKYLLTLLTRAALFWTLVLLSTEPTFAAASRHQPATASFTAKVPPGSSAAKTGRYGRSSPKKNGTRPVASLLVLPALKQPAAAVAVAVAAAPQVMMLRGIVLMASGQPRSGASVSVVGAPRQIVVTDAQGAFALPVPAGAAVSLRVEYFGEGTSRVEVPMPTASVLHITLGQ